MGSVDANYNLTSYFMQYSWVESSIMFHCKVWFTHTCVEVSIALNCLCNLHVL